MLNIILIILIIIILSVAIYLEVEDRAEMNDHPHCNYILNYCNTTAQKNDIKLILKQPTEDEKINLLLDKLSDKLKKNDTVFWRMGLIVSITMIFIYIIFNYYSNQFINTSNYIFLTLLIFAGIYWVLNHFQFHIIEACGHENQLIINTVKEFINKKILNTKL